MIANKSTYILLKDYESPMCKVYKGVGHTIKEWLRYFPKLSEEDFDIKTDWFKKAEPVHSSQPISRETWKHTEVFQWTDELVKEFLNYWVYNTASNGYIEAINNFKQSKVKKEEPLWEILEYKGNCTGFIYKLVGDMWMPESQTYAPFPNTENGIEKSGTKIHSVKRLSDGEVFSVGDKVKTSYGTVADIESMRIAFNNEKNKGNPDIYVSGANLEFGVYLDDISKLPPKESPLPIKVESIVFYTSMGTKPIRDVFSVKLTGDISEDKLQDIKKAIDDVISCKTAYGLLVATGNIESYNMGYSMGYKDANK